MVPAVLMFHKKTKQAILYMCYICIRYYISETSAWVKNNNKKAEIPNKLKITLLEETKLKELTSCTG